MDNQGRPTVNGNSDAATQYRKKTGTGQQGTSRPQGRPAARPSGNAQGGRYPRNPAGASEQMSPEMVKMEKRKAARRKMLLNNFKRVSILLVVVISISALIAGVVISCINDLLAIHVSEKNNQTKSVVITEGMGTNQVIDALADAGVIKNAWFCKIAAGFIGYSDEGYLARTYELHRSMGLENMLNQIKDNSATTAKTVTLTFPEGYTADQIINMLAENNVCSREKLLEAIRTIDFTSDFNFLLTVSNPEQRYIMLEGFLFPDTYEFYIGEAADSVLKKFLNNFSKKWTDDYAELARSRKLSVDQVVKLASIVEKEAVGEDMPVVGSILFNRISAGMRLECDSTSGYIASNSSGLSESEIAAFNELYDTYVCSAMPVGAICNPGADAIEAVLNAPDTDYYYFIHDANNEFHVAKSLSEQNYNIATYGLAQ